MTTQHTPGPWAIENHGGDDEVCDNQGRLVAIVAGQNWGQYRDAADNGEAEFAANTRLIAAAPDLLMHLKKLIAAVDREAHLEGVKGLAWDRAQLAKAVVAEAEGEPK